MAQLSYPAVLRKDEDGRLVVRLPDFQGAVTDGKDIQEAINEAQDCLASSIEFHMARREAIPPPSEAKRGQRLIAVPLYLAPKLALYMAMWEQDVSQSELARRMKVRETVIRRLLNPKHASRPETLQAALAAVGKLATLTISDAA